MKYRKKPIVIEAYQMTRKRRLSIVDWPTWLIEAWNAPRNAPGVVYPTIAHTGDGTVTIGTLSGEILVDFGDWIIRGVQGELYACKPDIFDATYDAVEAG